MREEWGQRKGLRERGILRKIWYKPRWRIWIRPLEFRKARFQSLDQCRQFVHSFAASAPVSFPYPWLSGDAFESAEEWIVGEIDTPDGGVTPAERWALSRSGQFVGNRALRESPPSAGHVQALEMLDTATATLGFSARIANRGILSPKARITFEL